MGDTSFIVRFVGVHLVRPIGVLKKTAWGRGTRGRAGFHPFLCGNRTIWIDSSEEDRTPSGDAFQRLVRPGQRSLDDSLGHAALDIDSSATRVATID